MARKAEPSLELKTIIWDIAVRIGKTKLQAIQKQVDYEIEKRRKSNDVEIFEDTPDTRTIKRIVNDDINEIPIEAVISTMPRHLWLLRNDYQELIKLESEQAQSNNQEYRYNNISASAAEMHDKGIFAESDKILDESGFGALFESLYHNYFLDPDLTLLLKFMEYFNSKSNQYLNWHLNYLCFKLCRNYSELSEFIQMNSIEYSHVFYHYDKYCRIPKNEDWCSFLKTNVGVIPQAIKDDFVNEVYFVLDERSHKQIMCPEIPDIFKYKYYTEWKLEFVELLTDANSSYEEYRDIVRSTLSI